jgi:hypothetical protein
MERRLSPRQVEFLLEELCVDLGFCLPPDANAQLMREPPTNVDAFTDAVIRAEGFEPHAGIPKKLHRDVRNRVTKYFEQAEDEEQFGGKA